MLVVGTDASPQRLLPPAAAVATAAAQPSLTLQLARPLCSGNLHRKGRWVFDADARRTKAFPCCSASKNASEDLRSSAPTCASEPAMQRKGRGGYFGFDGAWAVNTRVSFAKHGCACDRHAGSWETPRAAERWRWEPTRCVLPSWNASTYCNALGARRVLFVGDSTMEQYAGTMVALVKQAVRNAPTTADSADALRTCLSRHSYVRDDTLIGRCLGSMNSNPLGFMKLVRDAEPPPDVVVLNAGAHVYDSLDLRDPIVCGPPENRNARACPSRCLLSKHHRVNASVNTAVIERVVAHVIDAIGRERVAPDGRLTHTAFVWKGMAAGHYDCPLYGESESGPASPRGSAHSVASHDGGRYQWAHFPRQDAAAEAAARASRGLLHFMDMSMLYSRPDGHGAECLHWCVPGPLGEGARVLQAMLGHELRADLRARSMPP